MSKVFVFGGSGRVATELIKDLVADGNIVTAASRHPEKIIDLANVTADKLDLHSSVSDIAKQIQGFDAIYFTAGSRGKDVVQTDAMGAIKTMMAAKRAGIKRYIMLSSMFSLDVDSWNDLPWAGDYLPAKFFADTYLKDSSDLDYTIVQPTGLKEEAGTDKIQLHAPADGTIAIPDVAKVLADSLKHDNTIGKIIPISSGDTDIDVALKSL